MKDLMIDLETMGSDADSVICSIGAVQFCLETGEIGRQFYEKVSIQSCLDAGLQVNGSTIEWWLRQNEVARLEVASGGNDLRDVLVKFSTFISELEGDQIGTVRVWANSPRFDCGIMKSAYSAVGWKIPWNFRGERDVRTLLSLTPDVKSSTPNVGTAHNAVDDCLFQIDCCRRSMMVLSGGVGA